jgi:hypothetical protein
VDVTKNIRIRKYLTQVMAEKEAGVAELNTVFKKAQLTAAAAEGDSA